MTVAIDSENNITTGAKTLPTGWIETTLGTIRSDVSRGILPSDTPEKAFDLYSIPNFPLRQPEVLLGAAIGSNKQTTAPGTVLLSKINPRINRVWLVGPVHENPQIASTEWISFSPLRSLNPAYLAFYMQRTKFRDYLAANVSGVGGSLTRTNTAVVDRALFSLPPLAEQGRIVAKIEELFSKLDAGVQELKRTQVLLKRYRQSLLHAAVTGELSRTWRERQGENLEDAGHLLSHLLEERRARWAASGRRGKYTEPKGPDVDRLPELPKGWVWASVEQLGKVQLGRQRSPKNISKDHPTKYIRAANITNFGLKLDDILDMEFSPEERLVYELKAGDIVLSEASGSPDQVGKPAIWNNEIPNCCFQNTVIRVQTIEDISMYLYLIFKSYYVNKVFANLSGGVGINHLSAGKLSAIEIPLPSLIEQSYIISEVERRLSILDDMEATVVAELKRAESTRQSILHRAFSGQLVAQDPNDEPASVLLERIQAERVAAGAAAVRAGGRRGRKPKGKAEVGQADA